jgi:hypothetical protein
MGHTRQQKRVRPRARRFDSDDGVEFVRCRICGDYRRVISGRHLLKHGTDRETYMEEYRLSPDELIAKDFRMIQSSRRGYYPYGKSDWIDAIKNVHKTGGSVFAGNLQDKHPYLYQQGIWIFGDWDKALRAAGFDPERMRMRRFWDKERIINELQRMRRQSLPLYANYAMKNHSKLFYGALTVYGSWSKALFAAGVTKKPLPSKLYRSRLSLLRALRDALERHSKDDIPQALRLHAAHYFGSLGSAMIALKKDQRLLRGWSKPKIIAVLSQMHRSKKKLAYATARRHLPALVSAAEAYFGSWGKALYAAGMEPDLYFVHHKWRKPK